MKDVHCLSIEQADTIRLFIAGYPVHTSTLRVTLYWPRDATVACRLHIANDIHITPKMLDSAKSTSLPLVTGILCLLVRRAQTLTLAQGKAMIEKKLSQLVVRLE